MMHFKEVIKDPYNQTRRVAEGVRKLFVIIDTPFSSMVEEQAYFVDLLPTYLTLDFHKTQLLNSFGLADNIEHYFVAYTTVNGTEIILPIMRIKSVDRGDMFAFYRELQFPYLASYVLNLLPHEFGILNTPEGRIDACVSLTRLNVLEHYREYPRQRRCLNKNTMVSVLNYKHTEPTPNLDKELCQIEAQNFLYFLNKDFGLQLKNATNDINACFTLEVRNHSYGVRYKDIFVDIDTYVHKSVHILHKRSKSSMSNIYLLCDTQGVYKALIGYFELQQHREEIFWVNSCILRSPEYARRSLGNFALYCAFDQAYKSGAKVLNLGINIFDYKKDYNYFPVPQIGISELNFNFKGEL